MTKEIRKKKPQFENDQMLRRLVCVNRVAKVVKGGKRFGFSALMVVGDGHGSVGYGAGKAREAPDAVRKATEKAMKSLVRIPLKEGRTLYHDVTSSYGAALVHMCTAPRGTGIIAGDAMRCVFEALGAQDVVVKSIGSSNPHNIIKATFKGLGDIQSPRSVAAKRNRRVSDILGTGPEVAKEVV